MERPCKNCGRETELKWDEFCNKTCAWEYARKCLSEYWRIRRGLR